METALRPVLGRISGSLTTVSDEYDTIKDSVTDTEYFRVKGYWEKIFTFTVTLNPLTFKTYVAIEGADGLPDKWIEWGFWDAELPVGTDMEWDWLSWDFFRVDVKPTVAGAHGKAVVNLRLSTM